MAFALVDYIGDFQRCATRYRASSDWGYVIRCDALRRRLAAVACALGAALLLASSTALGQGSEVIHVGAGPVDQATPLVYAVKAGIYKKYGVNVEVVKLASGSAIAAAMSGGSLELGQASTLSVIPPFAKGLPFTVIGNLAGYDSERPDFALLVSANAGIRTPKDLEGKILSAVSLQDQASVFTSAWLDARGVDRSSIKYAEVPASAALAAMEAGRIVGATVCDRFLIGNGQRQVRISGILRCGREAPSRPPCSSGRRNWVGEHRDAVDRFLRASQASVYIAARENESAVIASLPASSRVRFQHSPRGAALRSVRPRSSRSSTSRRSTKSARFRPRT